MRSVSPILQAARGSARPLLRAGPGRRPDRADNLWPVVRLLHRSHREEAAQPFLAGHAGTFIRHRRLQSHLQVLPELGYFKSARTRPRCRTAASPEAIAQAAVRKRLPIGRLHLQRSGDLPRICDRRRAACRERGIKTVAVSAGYICAGAAAPNFSVTWMPPISISRASPRAFTKICARASSRPCSIRSSISSMRPSVWFEITTLLIPGRERFPAEIGALCEWVMEHLGPDVPLHFTAFHPDWKMRDTPPTPPATLRWRAASVRSTACATSIPAISRPRRAEHLLP